jgi:hypothetical protein
MTASFSWTWGRAVQASSLKATTKTVLWNLMFSMDADGSNCFPTTAQQAQQTGLSERAVCEHLQLGQDAGFIEKKASLKKGRDWKNHVYVPTLPGSKALTQDQCQGGGATDGGSVPQHEGTDGGSVRNCEGTDFDDTEALTHGQSTIPLTSLSKDIPPSEAEGVTTPQEKSVITVPPPANPEGGYPAEFETFWKVFPKNVNCSKKETFKSWKQARKKDTAENILLGVDGYLVELAKPENREWLTPCHATTWLNKSRWEPYLSADEETSQAESLLWPKAREAAEKNGDTDAQDRLLALVQSNLAEAEAFAAKYLAPHHQLAPKEAVHA